MGFFGNVAQARNQIRDTEDQQANRDAQRQALERQKMLEMALQIRSQNETGRHNQVGETQNANVFGETTRHNAVSEGATNTGQIETKRHNTVAERIAEMSAARAAAAGEREDRTLVPVQHPDGSVIYTRRAAAEGQPAPSPNARGTAAIMKDVASNQTQVSVIDDALKELDSHPDAVGLKRGAADLPLVGGMADAVNQRMDPGGVAARASLANVSSLVIKDRSGSAVTISESGRLRPFIPSTGDTPATIRIKLAKLRQAINTETQLLQASSGIKGGQPNAPSGKPALNQAQFEAGLAKGHSYEEMAQHYDLSNVHAK